MSSKSASTMLGAAVALLVSIAGAMTAAAADGAWTGATDANWTTADNWSGGVPGTGNTATFNAAGNGNTIVSLGTGVTVSNITFDTPSAVAYTIGSGAVGSEMLTLNNTGARITVGSTVGADQTFTCAVKLGTGSGSGTFTFLNNSVSQLGFSGTITAVTGSSTYRTLSAGGAGPVEINGNIINGCPVTLAKTGTGMLTFTGTGTFGAGNAKALVMSTASTIDLSTTGLMKLNGGGSGGQETISGSGGTITGGTIELTGGTGRILAGSGGLTIDSLVTGGALNPISAGSGILTLNNPANTYAGKTTISGILRVNSIKNADGTASGLGAPADATAGTIAINGGTLAYIGTGDTSDRVINLSGTTSGATLDQSGTGLLKFASALTATGAGSKTLTLTGSTAGTGELAGAVVNNSSVNKTSVATSGTGAWTLSGASTYTGTTTVNGGKLIVSGSTAAGSAATVNAGGTLEIAAAGTVGGAVTVNTGGSLKVVAGGTAGAAVTVSGGVLAGTGTVTGGITLSNTAVSGIDLRDGAAGTLSGSTLTCSGGANTGNNRISFDLGNAGSNDKIVLSGAHTAANAGGVIIRLNVLPSTSPSGTYTLIQGGAASTFTGYTLETSRFGGRVYELGTSGNDLQVSVSAGDAGPSATSWTGATSTDWTVAGNWTAGVPGYDTDVTFYNSGAGNLSTVLNRDFEIKSLMFSGTASTAVTIAKGTGSMLAIDAANGVTVSGSPAGGHTISAPLAIGANQTWTVDSGKKLIVSGGVSDLGGGYSIAKTGTGTLQVSGNSTFTGGVTLNSGTLLLNAAGVAGAYGPLGNGGTFTYNGGVLGTPTANITVANVNPIVLNADVIYGDASAKSLTLPGPITLTVDRLITVNTLNNSADALNLTGGISGEYALTKAGPYKLSLNGNNTFSGGVTLNEGTLTGEKYGTGTLTINGGSIDGPFTLVGGGSGKSFSGPVTLGGSYKITNNKTGPITFSGALNLGNNNTLTCEMNSVGYAWTISGAISGNNSTIIKTGSYPLTLSGSNSYNGDTTVNAGTLALTSAGALGNTQTLSIAAQGAKVSLPAGMTTVSRLVLDGKLQPKGTWGSSASSPTPMNVDDVHFVGTGVLNVLSGRQSGTVILLR